MCSKSGLAVVISLGEFKVVKKGCFDFLSSKSYRLLNHKIIEA